MENQKEIGKTIKELFNESIEVKQKTLSTILPDIIKSAEIIIDAVKNNKKIIFCGNGGSAADAQHLTTELIHQFETKRKPIFALSLSTNTSTLTAIGNDWGFDRAFSRQVEGIMEKDDILVAISTSGNSKNILLAAEMAKKKQSKVIAFSGKDGGKLKSISDISIIVPSLNTARIQETHITIGHIICKLIDERIE